MRSLAQLQLAQDPSARAAMEQQFDLSDGADEDDEETQRIEVRRRLLRCVCHMGYPIQSDRG